MATPAFHSLDALAEYLGFPSYLALSKVIYPQPRYKTFSLHKRSGGTRTIAAPRLKLKTIQTQVLHLIEEFELGIKPSAHGFIKKKSILSNASVHLNKQFVFNIDLENFFDSIHFGRVRGVFLAKPFEFPNDVATVLAHICCRDKRLPQGAPTSPIISNLVCRDLDKKLQLLAKNNRASYSRYCDDITFSFTTQTIRKLPRSIVDTSSGIVMPGDELEKILLSSSFSVNRAKTRLQSWGQRMEVTGISVNSDPNVSREYVHNIRGMLNAWENHGLKNATQGLVDRKLYKRQLRTGVTPRFDRILRGKLLYLSMIKGKGSPVYIRLAERFNACALRDVPHSFLPLTINRVVADIPSSRRATFRIECLADVKNCANSPVGSSGTAFLVAGDYIVTCEHVISQQITTHNPTTGQNEETVYHFGNDEISLFDSSGKELAADILFRCNRRDIALLKPRFKASDYPHFCFSKSAISHGQEAILIGFPNPWLSKRVSIVHTSVTTEPFVKSTVRYFEVAATIRKGNSGGPVTDGRGALVGIAVEGATYENGDNGVVLAEHIAEVIAELLGS